MNYSLNRQLLRNLLLAAVSTAALPCTAHTPYLLPATFEPVLDNRITLDASFAEKFFVPEAAYDKGEFSVVRPDGTTTEPDALHLLKTRLVAEHQLQKEGTFRFSTGVRFGRVFIFYTLNGERKVSHDPNEPLPEGAQVQSHFQAVSHAESYVTRGAPSQEVIHSTGSGLELLPETHPNELFAHDPVALTVLFNNEPLQDSKVEIFRGQGTYSPDKAEFTLQSNNKGKIEFVPEVQGVYLVKVNHRAPAPKGSLAPTYSHTYTLTLEVID